MNVPRSARSLCRLIHYALRPRSWDGRIARAMSVPFIIKDSWEDGGL